MKSKKIDWICIGIYIFIILFGIFGWKILYRIIDLSVENGEPTNYNIEDNSFSQRPEFFYKPTYNMGDCKIVDEIQASFYELTEYERWYIECMVAGEAGGESLLGKMAVAQCILNAMIKNGYSPKEVKTNYKYSGWDENLESKNPEMYEEVKHAVWCVFDNGEVVSENPILFFYAYKKVAGKWHKTLPCDQIIGGHSFHYLESDVNADWFVNMSNGGNENGDRIKWE